MNNPHGKGIPRKYNFQDMVISIPETFEGDPRNIRAALRKWGKVLGYKFKTRATNKGLKVCRINSN